MRRNLPRCAAHQTRPVRDVSSRAEAGFTLIELVAMMLVMGVLAVLALPRMAERNTYDQLNLSDRLQAAFRLAQHSAQSRNRDVCVSVSSLQVVFSVASAAGNLQPCSTPLIVEPDDPSPSVIEIPNRYLAASAAPVSLRLSFSPIVSFRFTPAGPLGNIGATNSFSSPNQPINIARNGAITTTINISAANGYVSLP